VGGGADAAMARDAAELAAVEGAVAHAFRGHGGFDVAEERAEDGDTLNYYGPCYFCGVPDV